MSSAGPEQVAAFLKMKLEQRSTNLREAFRKLAKSNTGFLSHDDFEGCLRDFNIRLPRSALTAVVAKYDVNGDGLDEIGIYQNGRWYFDMNLSGAWEKKSDLSLGKFGGDPDDRPVIGNIR